MPSFNGFNSPVPFGGLASECEKAGRIMNNFKPGHGLDTAIPAGILAQAKGLAIFTVLKAGFLFSGRAGSGLVIARLPDGSWSAPSAIVTAGMGFGGQIGAELTDFVMVLNTHKAVKTFMQKGSITLGGNISVAAGPVGRNAEASGTASLKNVAAVYSYSKTRGLFAGVSLEGSVIFERSDLNKKMYQRKVSGRELLNGSMPPPQEANSLYRALDLKFHSSSRQYSFNDHSNYSDYNDVSTPSGQYGTHDLVPYRGQNSSNDLPNNSQMFSRGAVHSMATGKGGAMYSDSRTNYSNRDNERYESSLSYVNATPVMNSIESRTDLPKSPRARAMFNFAGERDGDLSFRKGDIICITHKTGTQDDWWTGENGSRKGTFPANFVEMLK